MSDLFEKLAAIEHERWAHWQKYMHGVCSTGVDGALVIPVQFVEGWERQINTPYAELSEAEKESDRDQVRRYWDLVRPNWIAVVDELPPVEEHILVFDGGV